MKFRSNRLIPTNEWSKPSNNNKEKNTEKIRKKSRIKRPPGPRQFFKQIARTIEYKRFFKEGQKSVFLAYNLR